MNATFKLKPEDELLLNCARTQINIKNKVKIINLLKKNLNWQYIIKMAFKHGLNPILYYQLNNLKEYNVPDKIINDLKEYYLNNAQKNLLFLGELIKISNIFDDNRISYIPYKGPTLAIFIYGNLSFRDFNDLDIYVPQKFALKSKKLLISMGYKPRILLNEKEDKKYIKSQKEYKFEHENNIALELQWRFISSFFSISKTEEEIFNLDNLIIKILNGHKINILNSEDLFLILCIHNSEHRWSSLKWICDIAEFIQRYKNLDWHKIWTKANLIGARRILLINLYLAKNLWDSKLPNCIESVMNNDKMVFSISEEIKENIFDKKDEANRLLTELNYNSKIRENTFDGIKDILKSAFLPTQYEWNNIKLPLYLYPFYYFLRPIFLLVRFRNK